MNGKLDAARIARGTSSKDTWPLSTSATMHLEDGNATRRRPPFLSGSQRVRNASGGRVHSVTSGDEAETERRRPTDADRSKEPSHSQSRRSWQTKTVAALSPERPAVQRAFASAPATRIAAWAARAAEAGRLDQLSLQALTGCVPPTTPSSPGRASPPPVGYGCD